MKKVIFTESQLNRVIVEAIQDHNTVFQYLHWLNNITEPGKVKSKFSSKEDFLQSLTDKELEDIGYYGLFYNCGCEFDNEAYYKYLMPFVKKYGTKYFKLNQIAPNNIDLTDEGEVFFKKLMRTEGIDMLNGYLNSIVTDECLVPVDRVITIPEKTLRCAPLYTYLMNNYSDLGGYWAYEGGKAYCGYGGIKIRLKGFTPIECIDWAKTASLDGRGDERELGFVRGFDAEPVRIMITHIFVKRKKETEQGFKLRVSRITEI